MAWCLGLLSVLGFLLAAVSAADKRGRQYRRYFALGAACGVLAVLVIDLVP